MINTNEDNDDEIASSPDVSKAKVFYDDPYNQYLYSGNYMLEQKLAQLEK